MAEEFNTFFTNIGPKLASKIPDVSNSIEDYLTRTENKIGDSDLTFEEFETAFKSTQTNKATGTDGLNCNLMIEVYKEIKDPLFYIFSKCINKSIFPDDLKIAKVIPIFKAGDSTGVGNYRPISVLPIFSKILERIIYNRIYSHLNKHNLLFSRQFGFQKNTSTEHAILQLADDIIKGFSKGEVTLGIFIDLSKAFDTVNHEILLQKLEYYGITNKTHKLLKNYLKNRKQHVSYDNDKLSEALNIICGVPQGSILGPLLFIIYINDLYKASSKLFNVMFADDTNLFKSGKNVQDLFVEMNLELQKISLWFKANKLSLNVSKTKYSIFHSQYQKKKIPSTLPKLQIDNTEIKRDKVTKFLGIYIDENLTWKHHIDTICSKISRSIGILYKSRNLLPKYLLKQLYFSFVHSHLSYGNIAWASTNKTKLLKLYRKQKHAIRVITFEDRLTPSKPLFEELKIQTLMEINIYQNLCFMFKCKIGLSPRIFHNLYTEKLSGKYNTRSKQLKEPIIKTKYEEFCISYRAPHLWNKITPLILESTEIYSLNVFKSKVKANIKTLHEIDSYF